MGKPINNNRNLVNGIQQDKDMESFALLWRVETLADALKRLKVVEAGLTEVFGLAVGPLGYAVRVARNEVAKAKELLAATAAGGSTDGVKVYVIEGKQARRPRRG